jgi:hypothetical protein
MVKHGSVIYIVREDNGEEYHALEQEHCKDFLEVKGINRVIHRSLFSKTLQIDHQFYLIFDET